MQIVFLVCRRILPSISPLANGRHGNRAAAHLQAAGGLSNREITGVLHLAEGTVKNHMSSVLTTLVSRDRTQAVLYAIHWDLI